MGKKICCSAVICFLLCNTYGQLSVSLHEPPAGIVQKNQLWNIAMINSSNTPLNVTITLSVVDNRDNQPVMTARTRSILVTNGVKQVKEGDVGPVDYTYYSSAFDNSRFSNAFLPIGNYRACYTFFSGQTSDGPLAEDCINLEIAPLSPPQLILPADSAIIETPYPQFSWLPPAPTMLFSNLNYDVILAEVQSGQTPEAAIQENLPVYSSSQLNAVVNNYPASSKRLDTGRTYAWRVVAKNGDLFAAQSEVWTFRVRGKSVERPLAAASTYLELKNENSYVATGILTEPVLGLKYYSYDKTHDATIRFSNEKGEVVKELSRTIQYGNNFLVIPLDRTFSQETTYFVEISDLQTARYKTSFRIVK